MIGFEFKKLFFKQYGLILIAVLAVLKLFSSTELLKPDYGSLTPKQREVYIGYINELGGVLTEEKESAILEKYNLLTEAKIKEAEIERKLKRGEYTTTDEYFEDLLALPEILSDKAAIEKLYDRYSTTAEDKEHRVLLAYDAPAMTVGQEYWLLFFICYISAASVYYERKIKNLQKASQNGCKCYREKLLALFSVIVFTWLLFAAIEFFALVSVVSWDNLSASLVSLEEFKETPYPSMTILSGFWAIQLLKLIGYLFTSSVTLIIIKFNRNLVLSIFAPIALNIAWIYLFSNNTAAFYQPFSLMRGSPYITGAHDIIIGDYTYREYSEIPPNALALLTAIAAVFILAACIAVIYEGKNRLKNKAAVRRKKAPLLSVITILAILLSGCSAAKGAELVKSYGHEGDFAESDGKYYAIMYETDTYNRVISCRISMLDGNLNVINDNIVKDIFSEKPFIDGIYAEGGYLYYSADFEDGSHINRISLTDFSEETVYFGDYAPFLGQTKYFDMITVWADGLRKDDIQVMNFIVSGGKIVISMRSGSVYSLDISTGIKTYLFEDTNVQNLCAANGKIFYLNIRGELMCFENNEKKTVSNRIFSGICSDGEYVYCCGASGVYGYDCDLNEIGLTKTEGKNKISAYDGNVVFETESGWNFIDKDGEKNIGAADEMFICSNGIVMFNNGNLSISS